MQFQPENLVSVEKLSSPCGIYEVEIQNYKHEKGWPYSRIIVRKGAKQLLSVDRNYSFRGGFFKGQDLWFWTGKHYQSQVMINLETGEQYESKEKIETNTFCWTGVSISADSQVLAVEGCVWGGPYEIRFYDFSNPSQGWKEIPCDTRPDLYLDCQDAKWEWKGNTFYYESYLVWDSRFNKPWNHLTLEELVQSHVDRDSKELDLYKVQFVLDGTMKIKSFWQSDENLKLLE